MPNQYFEFKQFKINQKASAMKVGTDGVLLGAWANVAETQRILDVGTGSGLIAIMLAQRTQKQTLIDAVEIEASAYEQAVENFQNCPWSSRINGFHLSFQGFCKSIQCKYDAIVSNPPFFMNGLKAKEMSRTTARHCDSLPFEDLLEASKKILTEIGNLTVILPVEEGTYFESLARINGFYLNRKVLVLPNPGKPAKRFLLEFSLTKRDQEISSLVVENGKRHEYSTEYKELTKDFYLKF